jgi:hypothetical protein
MHLSKKLRQFFNEVVTVGRAAGRKGFFLKKILTKKSRGHRFQVPDLNLNHLGLIP